MKELVLFTRTGCCLCEGLHERLRALIPPPQLRLVDVDEDPELQGRYGLEVPVLAVRLYGQGRADPALRELPRVPPRLAGERLGNWLLSHGAI